MAQFKNMFPVELRGKPAVVSLNQMFKGDSSANRIGAIVTDGGEAADLGGSCAGTVILANGAPVAVEGVVDGNQAYIVLPDEAYTIQGPVIVAVTWVNGGNKTTLVYGLGNINEMGGGEIQPGAVTQNIADLIEAIHEAVASIPADYSNLNTEVNTIAGLLKRDITQSYDDLTLVRRTITNSNAWSTPASSSLTRSAMLEVPAGCVKITVTPQIGSVVAFLSSDTGYTDGSGQPPQFSASHPARIVYDAATAVTYDVASDMKYIYILALNTSGEDVKPTSIVYQTVAVPVDDTLEIAGKAADAKTAGDAIFALADRARDGFLLVTDFEENAKYYTTTGALASSSSYAHSQMIPCKPGQKYYIGIKYTGITAHVACFDLFGNFVQAVVANDIEAVPYYLANGRSAYTQWEESIIASYAPVYEFTMPAGCYWMSLNLTLNEDTQYRQFIATKPVFIVKNSGNMFIPADDVNYNDFNKRKLCVIGPSGVMTDRWVPTSGADYVSGFQEHLMPYYGDVRSFGYSSYQWGAAQDQSTSIYDQIVTAAKDLTAYDDFLLMPSSNNLPTTGVGDVTIDSTTHEVVEVNGLTTTALGGVLGTINYIYTQNPAARIYISNLRRNDNYYESETSQTRYQDYNDKLLKLCDLLGLKYIDMVKESNHNYATQDAYTYDGHHSNSEGNRMVGLAVRRAIIGV